LFQENTFFNFRFMIKLPHEFKGEGMKISLIFLMGISIVASGRAASTSGRATSFGNLVNSMPQRMPTMIQQTAIRETITATDTPVATTGGASAQNTETAAPVDRSAEIYALGAERDSLQKQLEGLRSENSRCKKQQTGWTVATVIGGVGVVGTTAGAIYQGVDWSRKNKELEKKKSELEVVNTEIETQQKNEGGQQ
jgi:hypothetical protein